MVKDALDLLCSVLRYFNFLLRYYLYIIRFACFKCTIQCFLKCIHEVVQPSLLYRSAFIALKRNPVPVSSQSPAPFPQPTATKKLLSVSIDFPLPAFHINGITLYVAFCIWVLLLSITFSRFIHVWHLSALRSLKKIETFF